MAASVTRPSRSGSFTRSRGCSPRPATERTPSASSTSRRRPIITATRPWNWGSRTIRGWNTSRNMSSGSPPRRVEKIPTTPTAAATISAAAFIIRTMKHSTKRAGRRIGRLLFWNPSRAARIGFSRFRFTARMLRSMHPSAGMIATPAWPFPLPPSATGRASDMAAWRRPCSRIRTRRAGWCRRRKSRNPGAVTPPPFPSWTNKSAASSPRWRSAANWRTP